MATLAAQAFIRPSPSAQLRNALANLQRHAANANRAKADAKKAIENAARSVKEANKRAENATRQANQKVANANVRAAQQIKQKLVENLNKVESVLSKVGYNRYTPVVKAVRKFIALPSNTRKSEFSSAANAIVNAYMAVPNSIPLENNRTKERLLASLTRHRNWTKLSSTNKKLIIGALGSTVSIGVRDKLGLGKNAVASIRRYSTVHANTLRNAFAGYAGGRAGRVTRFLGRFFV